MKMCVEIYVIVFKQQFSLFKHPYQTGLKYIENDVILEV